MVLHRHTIRELTRGQVAEFTYGWHEMGEWRWSPSRGWCVSGTTRTIRLRGATSSPLVTDRHGDHERALPVPGHADQRDSADSDSCRRTQGSLRASAGPVVTRLLIRWPGTADQRVKAFLRIEDSWLNTARFQQGRPAAPSEPSQPMFNLRPGLRPTWGREALNELAIAVVPTELPRWRQVIEPCQELRPMRWGDGSMQGRPQRAQMSVLSMTRRSLSQLLFEASGDLPVPADRH